MKSPAVMKGNHARFLYTTGVCTQLNYIQRKAGQKAEFHHLFDALSIEVDADGDWFYRLLMAGADASVYDLDHDYSGYGISKARVETITWGDFHEEKRDRAVVSACFEGENSIIESLRPREQHVHGLADFTARSHHNRGSAYFLAQTHFSGYSSVADGMKACADKFQAIERDWCLTVVVDSNHDQAFWRWLEEADGHRDPVNASYWHRSNLRMFEAIEQGVEPLTVQEAVRTSTKAPLRNAVFQRKNDSWVVWADQSDGIECGMHGHRGPNGSRGSPKNYRQIGRRCNTAHSHSCGIVDGIYTAGASGSLDMCYNNGPSSRSHSHIPKRQAGYCYNARREVEGRSMRQRTTGQRDRSPHTFDHTTAKKWSAKIVKVYNEGVEGENLVERFSAVGISQHTIGYVLTAARQRGEIR